MEKEPKRTTKVKVVASRYAQSLQKQNLDARQRTRSAPSVSTTAASAGGATKRPASSISQDSSVAKAHGGPGTIRTESAPPPSDLRDRLAAYRANKAQLKQADSTNSRSKPQAPTGKAQSMQRPAFPQRISTPERPVKRPAKDPAVPKQTRTLSFTHDAAPSGKSIKPATSSSAKVLSAPAATTMCGDEEIELLQSLYLQLCFADAKAADTFRRQEQSAETQMIAAWKLLQSKLQLIQDTTLRLDRDKHVKAVEEHLLDQAMPFVQVATALPALTENMRQMCASLETSLHCMPTPGISCNPRHVKRHLEQLGVEVGNMLDQLQASSIDTAVANAVAFEAEMRQTTEKFNASLLQIASLLEELQHEVNTETSLVIHHIQQKRVDSWTTNFGCSNE